MQRLADIDRELAGFGKDEDTLRAVVARGLVLARSLGDSEAALAMLTQGASAVESRVPAGASARATTWEEVRRSSPPPAPDVGSGLISIDTLALDVLVEVPPVLVPPAADEAAQAEPPEDVGAPAPSADASAVEPIEQAEEEIAVRWTPEPALAAPALAVADDDEGRDVLAELMAEDARELARESALAEERTVLVRPGSVEVGLDDFSELEIDFEEETAVPEPEAPSDAKKSRPPPPPSRPPEAPASGFLSRLLRGGKG